MEDTMLPLSPGETFTFSCSPDVPCFNECCRDLNQFLTPYDIVRLKTALGLSASDFLERYAVIHDGPRSGLPVVALRPQPGPEKKCPFVTPEGCAVYADRPSACRIYPMARAVARCRETGRISEHFAVIREAHCRGHEATRSWQAGQWIETQGLSGYLSINDRFLSIISLKNQCLPGPLDLKTRHLFTTALYNTDHFRRQIAEHRIRPEETDETATTRSLVADDLALLEFGHRWIENRIRETAGI